MKVYTVTVFDNGDMKTSVWGVFDSEEKAKEYEKELMDDEDLNNESYNYYLVIKVEEHEVE